jgi:predicted CoA-binding protein
MSPRPSSEALVPFFDPRGVAVIGASRDPAKVGGSVLANLRAAGFEGRIWPVNPRADVVQGLPATASLLAIDEPVDLAVIAVPAPGVQPALKECVAKGIRGAIVLSAGFREAGEAGQAREAELRAWIREQPIRVLGPNCLGWIRPSRRLNATFAPGMPPAGGIAFLSHSGALATAILDWARARRLGFSFFATLLKLIGGVTAAVASVYGGYVALTYVRFGRGSGKGERNRMLDQFMPVYEIRERHSVSVWAPADVTLAAAREISFYDSRLARSIFALRALPGRFLGVPPAPTERQSFFDEVIALGWRELAHTPGRAVIMGAVTQPWRQQVVFRGLPADAFVAFREPGYAKIAWTLEVAPTDPSSSVFSTETRVLTTDPVSRERFRRYWAFLSPGVRIIRYEMLRLVKAEGERRSARRSRFSQPSATRPEC